MNDMEKDALERRIDELCQEVNQLKADSIHWELGNCPKCPNVADLQEALDQNVKLQKLIQDAYSLLWSGLDCTECPWYDECDTNGPCRYLTIFADHMRALGIEVPK